jgi:glyoxylase-like metal-dependent hydrolase (beta-lactamase superfamily II)
LEALLGSYDVGDAALHVLEQLELLLVRVVERLCGILGAVEKLRELRLDHGCGSGHQAHRSSSSGCGTTLPTMVVRRSMHPGWLSNAYLVYDEPGGTAVFVDSGAPLEPLLKEIERERLTPTHVLRTHAHADHVEHEDELGLPVISGPLETGGLNVEAIPTPGHSDDMVCFVVNEELVFSGDTLFKDSVGGGDFQAVQRAVMEVYMSMPHERQVLPGHTDETTIGREWEQNPFVRVWRGIQPEGTERCRVGGREAALVVWSPDYDGKGKAWVRFEDGRDAIVGGSRVERLG